MSTPNKPDPARGWMFVEKLLAEEEAERIEKLTDDELLAEVQRQGTDPARIPSGAEYLAKATARAAQRSAPADRAVPAAPSSPAPPAPPAPPVQPIAPVVPIRRPRRAVWLVAATLATALAIYTATKGPEPVTNAPSDRQLAEANRDMAEASCALKEWAACKASLDEAAKLDPAGESEPRVQKARAEVALGMAGRPREAGPP